MSRSANWGCAQPASNDRDAMRAFFISPPKNKKLELITAQAPVHRDDGSRNVAGEGRSKEADEVGDVLGLAVLAHRDLVLGLPLAVLGRVVAQDLLAHDAPRWDAVHGDPV